MIITVTLNPCIDYYIHIDSPLMTEEVNRGSGEQFKAAGKGLNVSRMLSILSMPSTAVAVLGGFTGKYIEQSFTGNPLIALTPVKVEGINRVNIKAWTDEKKAFCINGEGPEADNVTKSIVLSQLHRTMPHDWVLLCGARMKGFDDEFLIETAETVHAHGGNVVIDMEFSDPELLKKCCPELIKPNLYEFNKLLNHDDITADQLEKYLDEARALSKYSLISCGKEGAVLVTPDHSLWMDQPHNECINKAGAGDAMLAAFIGSIAKNRSLKESLQWAGAAGNAAASTVGQVTEELIESFLPRITVTEK
ncbi:MAG: hypothetical protein EOM64_08500 [Erysipelotrichia bacterium]|nr:hypothetical protein [Erysipelotrichia bacterium]